MASRNRIPRHAVAAIAAAAVLLAAVHPDGRALLAFVADGYLSVAPLLLAGVAIAGAARASGLDGGIARRFAGRPVRGILLAGLVGTVTPVCGITVLPVVAGLLRAGVGLGPVMAFWLSSPVTDPAMLALTAALLGTGFALYKAAAAFAIGVAAGLATLALARGGRLDAQIRGRAAPTSGCSAIDRPILWRFWREPDRRAVFRAEALWALRLLAVWMTLAFVGEHLLRHLLPAGLVSAAVGAGAAHAIPVAVLLGAPLYLDGYATLPLVRGLLDLGADPAAAMGFLIAGGITSAFSAAAVLALVRWPVFLLFTVFAIAGSVAAAYGYAALSAPA